MNTISHLEKYLELEGFSFNEISIGKHHAQEGIIIEQKEGCYNFSSAERGNIEVLKSFNNERDLVNYAFDKISNDKWLKAHIVTKTLSANIVKEAEYILGKTNIKFERNDISDYETGKTLYRIFVFGNDINSLIDFKHKFNKTL